MRSRPDGERAVVGVAVGVGVGVGEAHTPVMEPGRSTTTVMMMLFIIVPSGTSPSHITNPMMHSAIRTTEVPGA